MSLFNLISNLFLITNLIVLPIGDNYYFQENNEQQTFFTIQKQKNNNSFPLKKNTDSLGIKISAKSVLVKDINSDKILWSKNSQKIRSIASITKLMTALVLIDMEDIDWEKEIDISEEDIQGDFNKIKIYPWEKIKFKDLFISALVSSSNNGIKLLIKNTGLTEEEFVNKMNQKTLELKLKNTKFSDPTGLNSENISTAEEILILTQEAFSYANIKEATSNNKYSFRTVNTNRLITVNNTNELIGGYLDIQAGKTGYTEEAGFCLVSEITYQQKGPLLVVVLGSDSHSERFSDLKAITTWTFNNYIWE